MVTIQERVMMAHVRYVLNNYVSCEIKGLGNSSAIYQRAWHHCAVLSTYLPLPSNI